MLRAARSGTAAIGDRILRDSDAAPKGPAEAVTRLTGPVFAAIAETDVFCPPGLVKPTVETTTPTGCGGTWAGWVRNRCFLSSPGADSAGQAPRAAVRPGPRH